MQTQTMAKIQERRRRKVGRDSMESLNCAPFASFCGFCFAEHGFRPYCLKMPTVVFRTCSPVIFSRPFFFPFSSAKVDATQWMGWGWGWVGGMFRS